MKENLVNLNVNPCKMCMPLGAVTAFYGIQKSMAILHGSQGCSTYIRRHMATHYNEPVDIASSSLTEEGTVYGGEKNLLHGIENLIKVYQPELIGVATTCLAETIGEDINRMIEHFYHQYPEHRKIRIIPVSSPGYGGTQYEGFFRALHSIVKHIPMDATKHKAINVVTGMISPADTRYIKELLESFSLEYILLPDLSDNLDGGYHTNYERLPSKGTKVAHISKMAGARLTLELSAFTKDQPSVAEYLYETYGVPYQKCNLPGSLRDNDTLVHLLKELSGLPLSEKIATMRERYLDAMIDGHKYNAEIRVAVYGEPDFVYSTARLCLENGIMPLISATGSKCGRLVQLLTEEVKELADLYSIKRYEVLEDIDFQTIEEKARELRVNILIGNSDGRRMAEKLEIPLVRRGFPIHDRVGGQRLYTFGYEGTLSFLDEITNAYLAVKEVTFRKRIYDEYYKMERKSQLTEPFNIINEQPCEVSIVKVEMEKSFEEKTATHPCFNCGAHEYARMHLPVAPKCNISCNYCLRKYDCPNESRPGVTTQVLQPEDALKKFLEVKEKIPKLSVVGIAGPGDALANFEETKKTLQLIREQDKKITFCLSTNGLMLPQYVSELIELGVTHVTVTINTIDPKIGAQIYRSISYMGTKYEGETGAAILLANQLAGIKMLTTRGILCKVNIVMLKGINDQRIPEVVSKVKELGVVMTNIMQMISVQGSVFEQLPQVSMQEIMEMRNRCGMTLKQMYHCRQCRADAIGMLGQDRSIEYTTCLDKPLSVAVATKSGMLVDQHFGQVTEFYVYNYHRGTISLKEKRVVEKYCNGPEECEDKEDRISVIINTIADCDAVIAMRIGETPKDKLIKKGIRVYTTCDKIEDSVRKVASMGKETK